SDPSGFYRQMNFATRDRYRHAVEKIAKRSPRSEIQIARVAIELSEEARQKHIDSSDEFRGSREVEPKHHVGYYLVDCGRDFLERCVGCRRALGDRLRGGGGKTRLPFFRGGRGVVGPIMLPTVICPATAIGLISSTATVAWLLPLILLAIYGSQFAVTVI